MIVKITIENDAGQILQIDKDIEANDSYDKMLNTTRAANYLVYEAYKRGFFEKAKSNVDNRDSNAGQPGSKAGGISGHTNSS